MKEDYSRSRVLSKDIKKETRELESVKSWLEKAHDAIKGIERQVRDVEQRKNDIEDHLNDLKDEKMEIRRKMKRDALERDLKLAHLSLEKLNDRQSQIKEKKNNLSSSTQKLEKEIEKLHSRLKKAVSTFDQISKNDRLMSFAEQLGIKSKV